MIDLQPVQYNMRNYIDVCDALHDFCEHHLRVNGCGNCPLSDIGLYERMTCPRLLLKARKTNYIDQYNKILEKIVKNMPFIKFKSTWPLSKRVITYFLNKIF